MKFLACRKKTFITFKQNPVMSLFSAINNSDKQPVYTDKVLFPIDYNGYQLLYVFLS